MYFYRVKLAYPLASPELVTFGFVSNPALLRVLVNIEYSLRAELGAGPAAGALCFIDYDNAVH
jgi:hypothetical protein